MSVYIFCDISLFSSLRLFIDINRGNSTRHGRTDDHEISSDCQTNSWNEKRWDRSKTGRTMVLLMFDEEKSPIRHYYKRHFINRKRVISCQINSLAFVKVRNYDGFYVYTSRERIAWKFNWKVSRGIEYTSSTWREGYVQYSLIYVKITKEGINKRELANKGSVILGNLDSELYNFTILCIYLIT